MYAGMVQGDTDDDGDQDATGLALGGASDTVVANGFEDLLFGSTAFWTTSAADMGVVDGSTDDGSAFTGQQALGGFAGLLPGTNLLAAGGDTDSVFEYMDRTPFSTFDAFVGATSKYEYNMPSGTDADISLRYKDTLASGMSYSLNFSNAYDKNPIINIDWKDATGNKLYVCRNDIGGSETKYLTLMTADSCGGTAGTNSATGTNATLTFTQEVKRIQNIGGSFDTAIETAGLGPVVIRGEALYQKGTYTPVLDRGALSIGDLPAALTMRKGDRFKYVIGADITALTNMMISAQFIQDRNLDYIDNNNDFDGTTCTVDDGANCGVYTADYATMHLTNGLNKAEKDKNFYSLFFSKPFGASGEHRWNNIFMYEENGGKWNRLDAEFSIDDDTQATVEYNKYWGNENTQFGQLEAASNIQVGVKYSF
jgi:hypothetical protein